MTCPSVTLAALIQRVVIVAGAAALILAAFGLDSVPEVGGLGAPAFAASSPDDGVPGAVRAAAVPRWAAGGVGMRSAGGFRGVGGPASEPLQLRSPISRNCLTKPPGLFTTQSAGVADAFCTHVD